MSNIKKRPLSMPDLDDTNPTKKRRTVVPSLLFYSSNPIYDTLTTIENTFIMKMGTKILGTIAEYAAVDFVETCSICHVNKLFLVNEDFSCLFFLARNASNYNQMLYNISKGQWRYRRDIFYNGPGNMCDECSFLCSICNDFASNSEQQKCEQCKQIYCSSCLNKHDSRCIRKIPFDEIESLMDFDRLYDSQKKESYENNIQSIYHSLLTNNEHRNKLRTFDGYYPFISQIYKYTEKDIEQYLKLNKFLQNECQLIESCHISNDITLVIAQYGFGSIVECYLCHRKHHTLSENINDLSMLVSPTAMVKNISKNIVEWSCKQLFHEKLKYAVCLCSTDDEMLCCSECEKTSIITYSNANYCMECVTLKELKKCECCFSYSIHEINASLLKCDQCYKDICNDCNSNDCQDYRCNFIICEDCIDKCEGCYLCGECYFTCDGTKEMSCVRCKVIHNACEECWTDTYNCKKCVKAKRKVGRKKKKAW